MVRRRLGRSRRNYRRSSHDIGLERAREHIEAYNRLKAELGGTIEDVRQYFFSLPPPLLEVILDAYEKEYGCSAREYAEQTIRKWQNDQVKMGGQTAERLFKLLPPRMPLSAKYQLVENLWHHVGPKSKKSIRIGVDANIDQVMDVVRKHFDDVTIHYKIPEHLERRFNWLAAGDAVVKQDLLNHLRQYEKQRIADGTRAQIPVLIEHMRSECGQYTHRLAQVLKIGNHELELALDKSATGVAVVEPWAARPPTRRSLRATHGFGGLSPLLSFCS